MRLIANRPELVGWLERVACGPIAFFGIGLWTRSSYVVVVLSLTLWTFVRLQHTGTHNWAVLLVTLWCLLTVCWGDGLSLDYAIFAVGAAGGSQRATPVETTASRSGCLDSCSAPQ